MPNYQFMPPQILQRFQGPLDKEKRDALEKEIKKAHKKYPALKPEEVDTVEDPIVSPHDIFEEEKQTEEVKLPSPPVVVPEAVEEPPKKGKKGKFKTAVAVKEPEIVESLTEEDHGN